MRKWIREWRINRARRKIMSLKARYEFLVLVPMSLDMTFRLEAVIGSIAKWQMRLASLQGFGENYDVRLREKVRIKT